MDSNMEQERSMREGNVEKEYERSGRTSRKPMADLSPDEVKESVKEKVAKGLAAVAGALEGFSEQVRKNDLPDTAKNALHEAGETTRKVAKTAKDELSEMKGSIGRSGSTQGSEGGSYESSMDVHKEPSGVSGANRRSPPGSGPRGRRL